MDIINIIVPLVLLFGIFMDIFTITTSIYLVSINTFKGFFNDKMKRVRTLS